MKKYGVLGLVLLSLGLAGCPKPYIAAQRSILDAVDALKIADAAIVQAYPSIQGTDEERVLWLTKAVCALRVSRDFLQIGWDVSFYWGTDNEVCKKDGAIVPSGTEGAECVDGERTWQEWVRISAPVVIHAAEVLRDFGVEIPDGVIQILKLLGTVTGTEVPDYDTAFDACVEAMGEE